MKVPPSYFLQLKTAFGKTAPYHLKPYVIFVTQCPDLPKFPDNML